ncbi:hypothetical protein [Streptomyces nodosus]|uniref:hypothetical protein n=1 Tax=Streptomyces nodosus TaxID=40318 RepID=UPI00382776A8
MADDQNSKYEVVLHYGAWRFVTPYQEWHNERAPSRVPERTYLEAELAGRSTRTATLVRRKSKAHGEFHEELPPPAHTETYWLGPERPLRICTCQHGEHE